MPSIRSLALFLVALFGAALVPTGAVHAQVLNAGFLAATIVDNDLSGGATPGDDIDYQFFVSNSNATPATTAVVTIPAFPNTTLTTSAPAPTSTAGTLTLENGNTSIKVDLGTLTQAQGAVTITFRVRIDSPLPNQANRVNASGRITAGTGVPDAEGGTVTYPFEKNAAITTVLQVPQLQARLQAALAIDGNGNGEPDPGETLEYTAQILELNGFPASNVSIVIPAITGTTLNVGSVMVGSPPVSVVNSGNTGGDTSVNVSVASLPASTGVTLTYRVQIDPSPGVSQLTVQGTVGTDGFSPAILTHDPNGIGDPAPTVVKLADPKVSGSMTTALLVDNGAANLVDIGDTIRYTVVLKETNSVDVSGVVFSLTPQGFTDLIVGTVTSTKGMVTTGNNGGDTSISVTVGSMTAGSTETITFDVTVVDPLGRNPVEVSNQGTITGTGITSSLTDDPAFSGTEDPTRTAVTGGGSTAIAVKLVDAMLVGGSGVVAGDTIRYTLTITEQNSKPAELATFTLPALTDATLVPGSVTTTRGTVTTGNGGGDTTISVAIGTMLPRETVTIVFDQVVSATPGGTQISAQGSVAGNNFTTTASQDDPGGGATVTPIVTAGLDVTLAWAAIDSNGNGGLDLGEGVDFTAVVTKNGAADVDNVVLSIPAVTGLVFGVPISQTQGTSSVTGNVAAPAFTFNIGKMTTAGGAVTVVFRYQFTSAPAVPGQYTIQGSLASDLPTILTDDPDTVAVDDATVIILGPGAGSPALTVTLADSFVTDANSNGFADPGDRVRYTAVISETNTVAATGIVFTHPAIAETALVVGSVTTSQGTVITGNTGGDTTVEVSVGTLTGTAATIVFEVDVNGSLTPGANQLSAQGSVTTSNAGSYQTDDPATGTASDATLLALANVAASADILATMSAPSPVSPGASPHTYTVTLAERSGNPALGTRFTIGAIPNAVLIDGSVTTTKGSVTVGNGGGPDTTVDVLVGDMAGSSSVTITFGTTIANPVLPAGTLQITAQGSVQGSNITTVQTQDATSGGATVTNLAGPLLSATLVDALQVDADSDTLVGPGDTLRYTAVVSNTGTAGATNVVFDLPAIANASLVDGSVTATAGVVTSGNGGGPDTTVQVTIPSLANGASVTIVFDVRIDASVPAGVSQLSAQGTASASDAASTSTDDPAASGLGKDPTLTALEFVTVSLPLTDALFADSNGDGNADPGETLQYTVVLDTTGTRTLTGSVFSLTPDSNTTLLPGTVTTSKGTVTTGNGGGDTTVAIAIGDVAPTDTVTIQFQVQVATGLSAAVTQVSQQGTLTVSGRPPTSTDDPDVGGTTDPTVTQILRPNVSVTLADALQNDADSDTRISPGDTLRYTAVVSNTGNQAATGVVLTHPAIANAVLSDGSVTTTTGTIDVGNGGGPDTTVQVTLGTLAISSSATVTFDSVIDSPIATGTTQLSAQASVSASNAATVSSDDPAAVGAGLDPTVTPLDYVVESLTLVDSLFTDVNTDGNADPGDTLQYTAVIDTTGTRSLTSAAFALTPGANTTLVVGSVTTSLGTVTTGNTGGDSSVLVSVGTVTTTDTVTIQFRTLVASPLGVAIQQVSQQGSLTSTGRPSLLSDDPAVGGTTDPTVTLLPRPSLTGTLVAALQNDLDTDTIVDPGDTLRYTAVIANSGLQAGDTVGFSLTPEANTQLVTGTVTTSFGTVTTGNTGGDTTVVVAVGALPATTSATITFDATVRLPFPKTGTQVSNQGSVTSVTFPNFLTDDPALGGAADSTVTTVTRSVAPTATLTDTIVVDLDSDGVFDPGDSLSYTLIVTGGGDTVADTLNLTLAPDSLTTLDVGTVTTSQGSVTTGNTAGDSTIAVAIGDLAPGNSVTITFRVTANSVIPPGTTQVAAQGVVTGLNFSPFVTDDPDTVAADSTVTLMVLNPLVRPTLEARITNDITKPLIYTLKVTNTGNVQATGVQFDVTPHPQSVLVPGTVTANLGASIVLGNGGSDTAVQVTLANLFVGQVLQVEYTVTAKTPTLDGLQTVSEQGTLTGTNFSSTLTDDPATSPVGDPTVTTREAMLQAIFGAFLASGGGGGLCQASPGSGGGAWPWLLPLWWAWRRRFRKAGEVPAS